MNTEGTVQYNSLSWVKKQLDAVLGDAQSSLTDYIENKDTSSLQQCIDHLRLVYGTLQMVEVYGAAMLADEMAHTALAQLEGKVEKPEDVFDVLMRAMLQLPDYLESLQAGNKDSPIALLPLMNDLRAARNENLLSESVLFLPDVESVEIELSDVEIEAGKLADEAKRLRTHYQLGLLDFLRNNNNAGLKRMYAVINALQKVSADASVWRFWLVVTALIEGLTDEGVDSNISVKMLLGAVDRQIKLLIDVGEDEFVDNYSQELLKNALYYIGHSTSNGKRVSEIRKAYKLAELLPSESDAEGSAASLGGLNAELFDTVSQGIKEDLTQVKDALEIYAQSSERDSAQLSTLNEQLSRIADTYGMLGLGKSRQRVLDQRVEVERIISGESTDIDHQIMEMASELLVAESELNDYIARRSGGVIESDEVTGKDRVVPAAEYREVLSTVVSEALNNFSEAKEAILSVTSGIGGREQLDLIMQRLEEVRGITMMLPMDRVETQLAKLVEYVQTVLIGSNHKPDADEQDTVADVVTSIEYYLESMSEGRPGIEQGLNAGDAAIGKLNKISAHYEGLSVDEGFLDHSGGQGGDVEKKSDVVTPGVGVATGIAAFDVGSAPEPAPEPISQDDYSILGEDADEEIVEIFIEEAVEVLEELHKHVPKWRSNLDDEEPLAVIRRCFHTLKGSGRLIGADLIGEFSWKFENMLNRVIDKKIEPDDLFFSKLNEALAVLPQLIEQLKGNREPIENVSELMLAADVLSEGRAPAAAAEPVSTAISEEIVDLSFEDSLPEQDIDVVSLDIDSTALEENDEISISAGEVTGISLEDDFDIDIEASMTDSETIELNIDSGELDINEEEFVIDIDDTDTIDVTTGDDAATAIDMDPMLFKIYYDETQGHLQQVQNLLDESDLVGNQLEAGKDIVRAFHTLYGSARTAEIEPVAELCGATERYLKARQESGDISIPAHPSSLIVEVKQRVTAMLDKIKSGVMPASNKELLARINQIVDEELSDQLDGMSSDISAGDGSRLTQLDTSVLRDEPGSEMSYGEMDDDLIDIFLEEADELLESCEGAVIKITQDTHDADSIHQLQRYMHTLKGGARMAELTPVGDLTHALESLVIMLAEKKITANKALHDALHESVDTLSTMLSKVKLRQSMGSSKLLVSQLEAIMRGDAPEKRTVEHFDVGIEELEPAVEDVSSDNDEIQVIDLDEHRNEPPVPERRASDKRAPADSDEKFNRRASDQGDVEPHWGERATDVVAKEAQEQVRVRADLLNNLVNYAGEVNIHHARMGKQVSDIGFNLSELETTVTRLKEQLRSMDIETEIQIRSSYEKEADSYDQNFDPLEMDRYSTLQQLSRSLMETAGDVESIKDILAEIVRDSETLLLQESRVSTDLQEGLMRTRMVRFGGLATRLRRITRQTSRELGKDVELEIIGESSEVDRTVLDRIIAPLEHMLRNAVAHGIESPEKRKAAGKPETGNITMSVDRQGAEILIKVSDDGGGIDVDAIRKKATKQDLMDANSALSDHDVLQFILHAGFSTADEVTQVAGRGVGMDVVDSEIKQLGGILEIDTRKGKGTQFIVRLPLTLAINQALLVNAGDDIYAVPLASIEGVVRITGDELQKFYDSDQQSYEFNGVEYELKHLGHLLTNHQPDYSQQHRLFPVLLVHVGDQRYALHVDDMAGRREIVVKPVGVQLSTARGIAGATILADGRVVLILEMSSLVVVERILKHVAEEEEVSAPVRQQHETTVMVVDDSITIRKVTARMLERHGIVVMSAKDGVDATNQLQDHIPDLMLLDIEMPRMDGFEVATYVRNDERLKDLPIIMITSRTGEKHKEKAMEIGVNQYLGKPYQEDELMKNINELIEVAQ